MSETRLSRAIVVIASIAGGLGVLFGAFGSHLLASQLESMGLDAQLIQRRIEQFDIAARYHLLHAVAMLALGGLSKPGVGGRQAAAILFGVGIVLFSGSLYLLVLTNSPWLGAVTPLGGLAWIAGWCCIAIGTLRSSV